MANAQDALSSCCGAGLGKVFHKDEDEPPSAKPAADKPKKEMKDEPNDTTDAENNAAVAPAKPAEEAGDVTDEHAKYQDVAWSALPAVARAAAEAIGYDEQRWDDKEWLPIDDKDWEELTDEERAACETLGWDVAAWDDKYEGHAWADAPAHVRAAATQLGWDQEKWDEDGECDAWEKGWGDLSTKERRCLHVLGYCVHTWD